MATQRPSFSAPVADFAAALLAERELTPRARITAQQILELLPGTSVLIYALTYPVDDQDAPSWRVKWSEGDVSPQEREVAFDSGTLGVVAERKEPLLFEPTELSREDYAHLNVRRTMVSLAVVPIAIEEALLGAIEIVSCDEAITEEQISVVAELAQYAAIGFATAISYEQERNTSLESITRLTQLYDIEKVFNSTLEMTDLLPIICSKVLELMSAQGVNLWLVQDEQIILMEQGGSDPTVETGTLQKGGEGIAGDVCDSGEAVLIESSEDERLTQRNANLEEGGVFSIVAVPMVQDGSVVGVLEVVNRMNGSPFDEDDLFMLTQTSDVAATALHNASLLQAERKVEILETLVRVSQEITSTLNLDRVLQAVVNGPQSVIPYERSALLLEDSGRAKMKAISGIEQINPTDPDVKRLDALLRWVAELNEEIYVTQHDDEIHEEHPGRREKFAQYFEETGVRGFYALPLIDDQGRLGVLSYESTDPDFLNEAHFEMIKVLAGQATVAVRNASLYKEVPFINVLEPIMERKKKFMRMERRKRASTIAVAVAALLFLVFFPLPMRVDGDAMVAPLRTATVAPYYDGVVTRVLVKEGDRVKRGATLAEMDSWDLRSALAAAEAKRDAAAAEVNRALAANDGSLAGQKRVEADYWSAEVARARERVENTRLKAPIDGVIATPHVENLVGRKLDAGEPAIQVLDSSRAVVDVAVSESDVSLLHAGAKASVKLESYPTRTFRGEVSVVSPKSESDKDTHYFYARVVVPNPDGSIRSGMQGRSKVRAGWHPAGYVWFRDLGMWAWSKLWNWFGW